nr:PREDICTED: nucleolar protein 12-like isoform X2 [Saccoglossus kowalevskii]
MAAASHEFRQKHPKNRKNKFKLVFDEENRAEFLSGFHKRKEERRKKARDDAERKLKEAKRKEREERRKILKQKLHRYQNSASFHALDGLLNPEPTMYDHPEHTVTVTTITDVNLDENFIGSNEVDYVKDEEKNGDEAETTEDKHKK